MRSGAGVFGILNPLTRTSPVQRSGARWASDQATDAPNECVAPGLIVLLQERFVRAASLPHVLPALQAWRMKILQRFSAALFLVIGCTSARPPMAHHARSVDEQRHESTVRRYFKEVWSEGRLDVLDELLTEDYVNHTPSTPNPPSGPAGLKPIVAAFRQAFPDLQFTVEDVIVEGDRVAARVRMQGTHTGPLFGIAPTRRRVSVEQLNVELFRAGRIAEHWRVTDELGLMRQLGVIE
jgi:steroid delta-isomerase-like uncharacterized protein